jgi:hypothetical protein
METTSAVLKQRAAAVPPVATSMVTVTMGQVAAAATGMVTAAVLIFVTGNLKFYAQCLEEEGSESTWCWFCDLSHADWQKGDQARGEKWTLEKIKQVALGLGNG